MTQPLKPRYHGDMGSSASPRSSRWCGDARVGVCRHAWALIERCLGGGRCVLGSGLVLQTNQDHGHPWHFDISAALQFVTHALPTAPTLGRCTRHPLHPCPFQPPDHTLRFSAISRGLKLGMEVDQPVPMPSAPLTSTSGRMGMYLFWGVARRFADQLAAGIRTDPREPSDQRLPSRGPRRRQAAL